MVGIILSLCTVFISPTTVNGRFVILQNTGTHLYVLLQINTDTGTDDLGGATIPITFDTTVINLPFNLISGIDYIFHNFSTQNYFPSTVTRPIINQAWINITLLYEHNNNGTIVAESPQWTDMAVIRFNILDPNGSASISWLPSSIFWGIYDADNIMLWQTGIFDNLEIVLPIELSVFTATIISKDIHLYWKTETEINSYGFDIERSTLIDKNFEKIGFVLGSGNSNSPKEYSFIDEKPSKPILYYRLKMIDTDGTHTYSNVAQVKFQPLAYVLEQNYPNPFNPITLISYSIPLDGHTTLKIYDILGSEILILVDEIQETGNYSVYFDASGLRSGIYFYRFQSGKFIDVKKMTLLK